MFLSGAEKRWRVKPKSFGEDVGDDRFAGTGEASEPDEHGFPQFAT
jgi:hypothetical protein